MTAVALLRAATLLATVTVLAGGCGGAPRHEGLRQTRSEANRPVDPAACELTRVHYTRRPGAAPELASLAWIEADPPASGVVGYLFYYDANSRWKRRRLGGLRIFTRGRLPGGRAQTKILWVDYGGKAAGPLVVSGTRVGTPGQFRQVIAELGPSTIRVPSPGCWRLSLRAGPSTSSVTVLAVES